MPDSDLLRLAVERAHDCPATLRESVDVCEKWDGETVWDGCVAVFDLQDCPDATTAFAWEDTVAGKREVFAVAQAGAIQTPADAVRAAIVNLYRQHLDREEPIV